MRTEGEKSDATRLPQAGQGSRDEWDETLHPDRLAGQNAGPAAEREVATRSAHDTKEVHRALSGFTDDELRQIPILPAGARLQQGATYVDLAAARREEIRASGGLSAHPGHYWVPKDRVPYTIWNRLIGEPKPGQ